MNLKKNFFVSYIYLIKNAPAFEMLVHFCCIKKPPLNLIFNILMVNIYNKNRFNTNYL